MSHIIAITKEGIDLSEVSSIDDFIFHSDYDTLKYESQGIVTVTTDLSEYYHSEFIEFFGITVYYYKTLVTLEHGLEYTPYFAGYLLDLPSVGQAVQAPFSFGDAVFFVNMSVFADDTNLYFLARFNSSNSPTGTDSQEFGYRIFKNDLGL